MGSSSGWSDKTQHLVFEAEELLHRAAEASPSSSLAERVSPVHRRNSERLPVVARVTRGDGKHCYWKTTNISQGGLFVQGIPVMPRGTQFDVRLWLPEHNRNIELVCRARVAWTNERDESGKEDLPLGMGLAFTDLGRAQRERLAEYLTDRGGDSSANRIAKMIEECQAEADQAEAQAKARDVASADSSVNEYEDEDEDEDEDEYEDVGLEPAPAPMSPPPSPGATVVCGEAEEEGFIELGDEEFSVVTGDHTQSWSLQKGESVGAYEVLDLIGRGGMGEVYLVKHKKLGRRFALKRIHSHLTHDPAIVRRFFDEAREISQLEHPHIVQVTDFVSTVKHTCFVMEYVRGATLAARQRAGPLDLQDTLHFSIQLCDVLEELHSAGIIHRDLKPDNILLTAQSDSPGFVKLLDFGVAKFFDPATGVAAGITTTGMSIGTPGYMSPEQLLGDSCDYRTDVYALGVLMYEMVTGRKPFVADTVPRLMLEQTTATPPPPSEIMQAHLSAALEGLILQCLERDPLLRPDSVSDIKYQLIVISRGEEDSLTPYRPTQPESAPGAARWYVAVAAVLLAAVVGAWLFMETPPAEPEEPAQATAPMRSPSPAEPVAPVEPEARAAASEPSDTVGGKEEGGKEEGGEEASAPREAKPRAVRAPAHPTRASKPPRKRRNRRPGARAAPSKDGIGSFFEQFE